MKINQHQTIPNILLRFAQLLGTEVKKHKIEIPEKFGRGYCIGFVFNDNIRMIISNYELHEELIVSNPEVNAVKRMIFFKFQHVFTKGEITSAINQTPSVLIATSRLNTDDVISIHSNTATINIEVDADYLGSLFDVPERSPVLQSLLQNTQPLLFEQVVYPFLQKIVDDLLTVPVNETFQLFFLRVKAEELICRLLMELDKREEKQLYPLAPSDIEIVYKVREKILEYLDTPPMINELAAYAAMSPTKLKRVFRQIFGDSIFSYYQAYRMLEAARLLKEKKISVTEAGYRLGFTNLSHFSRVFTEHIGMKPKQYSRLAVD